jgi:hypothetical protein
MTADRPPPLPLTGGCLCGAVRYEISEPLQEATYCHCTRCQRLSGTGASANGWAVRDALHWVSGEEHLRVWWPPDGWGKAFCAICGAALFSRPRQDSVLVSVRLGSFDADPGIRPSVRHHTATAASWEPIPDDGLPQFPDELPATWRSIDRLYDAS